MLGGNKDNKINSILGPEVEVDGDVKVIGSILIYGKVNGNVTAAQLNFTVTADAGNGNVKVKIESKYFIVALMRDNATV